MSNWISVKDRLPDEHDSIFANIPGMHQKESDNVLVTVRFPGGRKHVMAWKTEDGEWGHSGFSEIEVTHWMPTPEPPEELDGIK